MEKRVSKPVIKRIIKKTTVAVGLLLADASLFHLAHAGVILAPPLPPPVATGPEEAFPESKFGAPPTRLSRRQDAPEMISASRGRSPAGLQFSGDPATDRAMYSGGEVSNRDSRGLEPMTIQRRGVQEVSVIAGDLGFFPKVIFATRDVPVRLYVTGASKNTLCFMMDSFQVRRQVKGGKIEEVTFTAGNAGKYRFYCPINGMEGSVVVREPSITETIDADRTESVQSAPLRESAFGQNLEEQDR